MSEWDEAKRLANILKHGLDFLDADDLFDGRPIVSLGARSEIEDRYLTVGSLAGTVVVLVWTWRGEQRRYISLRRARDEEKRQYRQLQQ